MGRDTGEIWGEIWGRYGATYGRDMGRDTREILGEIRGRYGDTLDCLRGWIRALRGSVIIQVCAPCAAGYGVHARRAIVYMLDALLCTLMALAILVSFISFFYIYLFAVYMLLARRAIVCMLDALLCTC